jgi:hypothetical protein
MTKNTCDTCKACYAQFPSLDPRVDPDKRLGMLLREVSRPLCSPEGAAVLACIEALRELVVAGPEKKIPTPPSENNAVG